jgi:hypothetical protein
MANREVFMEALGHLDEVDAERRKYSPHLLPHLDLELGDATLGGILYRVAEPAAPTTSALLGLHQIMARR